MRARISPERGTTLVELLVSTAAAAVILAALIAASFSIQRSIASTNQLVANTTGQSRILDYVAQDLRRALKVGILTGGTNVPLRPQQSVAITDARVLAVDIPDYYASNTPDNAAGSPYKTARYVVTGNLGTFEVAAPPAGTTGYVEIIVTGHLKPGSGHRANITIPPNVYAKLYVHGDVELSNARVNATAGSSLVASHLVIYGVGSSGSYTATGNHVGILCFHGPDYDAALHGTVETHGSIVAKSFRVLGGGNGGLHYDEALGRSGDITGWQAVGYFEDTRSDL